MDLPANDSAPESQRQSGQQPGDVTILLRQHQAGDERALDHLLGLLYNELKQAAQRQLQCWQGKQNLQRTELVHEAYLKLLNQNKLSLNNRGQFLGIVSIVMRRIIVDNARRRLSDKRGRGADAIPIEDALSQLAMPENGADEALAIDQALQALTLQDARAAKAMELKFFGGFELEEISMALGVAPATVKRDLSFAKAFLYTNLTKT